MSGNSHYIGNELELFSKAANWKGYYRRHLAPFIQGKVLEAGAGLGETTAHLLNEKVKEWICLEPDQELAKKITIKIQQGELPSFCQVMTGTSADINDSRLFDTIVYIDVIEHIEQDGEEMQRAFRLLRPGGHLIILVPAHQWLFSPFDAAIGHFRRYNKKRLMQAIPPGLEQVKLIYLDSIGLFASLANKLLLRKSYPTEAQVRFWDKVIVPVSRIIDPILLYKSGKSLIGVWKKNQS